MVEDAEPLQLPDVIRKWPGLNPEKRWWLYTRTSATTSQEDSLDA